MDTAQNSPDFKTLFASSPGLYLVLDAQLRIVAVSEAYARTTMTRCEEILGKPIFEIFTDSGNHPAAPGGLYQRLDALLRAAPIGTAFSDDPACQYITGNPALLSQFEMAPTDNVSASAPDAGAAGRRVRYFHQGREVSAAELPLQRAAATNEVVAPIELEIELPSGRRWFAEVSGAPVRDAEGKVIAGLGIVVDITSRKQSDSALRESNLRQKLALDGADLGLWDWHIPTGVVTFNERWSAMLGCRPDEIEPHARSWQDRVHPEDWPAVKKVWTDHSEGRTPSYESEHRLRHKDGHWIWVLDKGRVIERDAAGKAVRACGTYLDITESKRVEAELRRKEAELAEAQRIAHIGSWYWDAKTDAITGSDELLRIYGFDPARQSMPAFTEQRGRCYPVDDWERVNAAVLKTLETGVGYELDVQAIRDGMPIWVSTRSEVVRGAEGRIVGLRGTVQEITARKQSERELAESRQRLAGIVGSAMDAIISVDADHRIVLFNAAAEKIFRCAAVEAMGCAIERFIPERFRAGHAEHIRHFGSTGVTSRTVGDLGAISGLRADGQEFPVEASISQVEVGSEKIFTVVLRDITERKQLEHEVLEISAREQRRIGQDLHDDLCQWLVGTELLSVALAKDLAKKHPAYAARAQQIAASTQQAVARARMLARGLAPAVSESEELAGALRELAANARAIFQIRCRYDGPEAMRVKDEITVLHLYRIAQEAITNAVRHGNADEVRIVLRAGNDWVSMLIGDNGMGMPKTVPETCGMGLRTMRYRAHSIGATLEIQPGASAGTDVRCVFTNKV